MTVMAWTSAVLFGYTYISMLRIVHIKSCNLSVTMATQRMLCVFLEIITDYFSLFNKGLIRQPTIGQILSKPVGYGLGTLCDMPV